MYNLPSLSYLHSPFTILHENISIWLYSHSQNFNQGSDSYFFSDDTIQYRTILFHTGWKQKCYFKSMKFWEWHCILYIERSKANYRLQSLQRCYTAWTNWMSIIFRMSTLIVASKLLTFLTVSPNNSLQLFSFQTLQLF